LKIHIAVNVKTKKILSITVTDEHAHDSKMLPELVDEIIDSDSITTIGKLLADGAYESNDIFRCLADNGIMPYIKVRRNARVKKTNHIFRNLSKLYFRKTFARVEGQQRKLWTKMDCRNRIFLYKENIWRVCLFR
jgi:hypothetical protein